MATSKQAELAVSELVYLADDMLRQISDMDKYSAVDYMLNALVGIIDQKDMDLLYKHLKKMAGVTDADIKRMEREHP